MAHDLQVLLNWLLVLLALVVIRRQRKGENRWRH
jgi:hypothetical protein